MLPTLNRVLSYIVFVRTPRSTALTEQEIHCQTESPGVAVATFVKELPRYLQKTLDVTKLHTLAVENRICLVCFEEDPSSCHRSIVAEYVARWLPEVRISHLRYA